jgi:hypothetical protein
VHAPAPKPVWDDVYMEWVVPCSCACCNKCWLVVKGKRSGRCVNGGYIDPARERFSYYTGYVEVKE